MRALEPDFFRASERRNGALLGEQTGDAKHMQFENKLRRHSQTQYQTKPLRLCGTLTVYDSLSVVSHSIVLALNAMVANNFRYCQNIALPKYGEINRMRTHLLCNFKGTTVLLQ